MTAAPWLTRGRYFRIHWEERNIVGALTSLQGTSFLSQVTYCGF